MPQRDGSGRALYLAKETEDTIYVHIQGDCDRSPVLRYFQRMTASGRKADTRWLKIQLDARLNIVHHVGERQAMEWEAICFKVCIAAVLLIFAPAKSPQRDVQL